MTDEPIERLEQAIELAERMPQQSIPISSTLCEIYRASSRGFTDEEATYLADRLELLLSDK